MDALGAAFVGGLAVYLVYGQTTMVDASDTGLLNRAVAFSAGILWVSVDTFFALGYNTNTPWTDSGFVI
jgi:hypothetical protein